MFYVKRGDRIIGQFSTQRLKCAARSGQLLPSDTLSADGANWRLASEINGLTFLPALEVPQLPESSLNFKTLIVAVVASLLLVGGLLGGLNYSSLRKKGMDANTITTGDSTKVESRAEALDTVPDLSDFEDSNSSGETVAATVVPSEDSISGATEQIRKLYQLAAEQNLASAQFELSQCYVEGIGVSKDMNEAVKWCRKAAEQDDVQAQVFLGKMYEFGEGVSKDEEEAVRWFQKSADQGYSLGQYFLALAYSTGTGIEKDFSEALVWYHKAAEQGLACAVNAIGYSYEYGEGVRKNDRTASEFYLKAARLGDEKAMYNIGMLYATGRGVQQNQRLSREWLQKSAAAGFDLAKNQLNADTLNILGAIFAGVSGEYESEEDQWSEYRRKNQEQRDMINRNGIGNSGSPYGY